MTFKPLPLLSVSRASKAAVNALTEAAAAELAEFGIRARVVLPGAAPTTNFGSSARARVAENGGFPPAYAEFAERTIASMAKAFQGRFGHDGAAICCITGWLTEIVAINASEH